MGCSLKHVNASAKTIKKIVEIIICSPAQAPVSLPLRSSLMIRR